MRQTHQGQRSSTRADLRAVLIGAARRLRAVIVDGVKDFLLKLRLTFDRASRQRADATDAWHILMIDNLLPDPLFGAGYPRASAIVHSLVKGGYKVDFYPMESTPDDLLRMNRAFAGAVRFHRGEGARGLRRLLWREGDRFETLFVSRPTPMKALIEALGQPSGDHDFRSVIYDAEAVLSPREVRRRALFGLAWSEAEYQAALAAELSFARGVQAVTAVGHGDADVIGSVLDVPVFVLPHPVTVRPASPDFPGRQDILFVGRLTEAASQSPNVDSVQWFTREVMPQLDHLIGTKYRFHIVGRVEAPEIIALTSDRVILHGVVEDLQPLYDRCRLFVAPTRYAAGIPLKVVEAMGEGIPCVATPLLAQQLAADDIELTTGDGATDFAEQCARLYTDVVAWRIARDGGIAHVRRTCSPAAFDRVLVNVLDHVLPA
ncbi:glycosyltransferase [Sphingomonas mollis]|uniref:Glycosyltransferase family 4 protein n=1 Tax=Sphingomonas mollis TaxID=2795726 RepID=A0ABS0XTG3_9SPHN|nr:glycosyltransferase [Sphingomonas sp. BT553]MBJ6123342.1 glycosyltransferase family 4 protein [Sphingomonas sp. BT553]